MQNLAKATLTLIAMSSLIGCVEIDDATGLEALREPIVAVAESTIRIDDDQLTAEVRNLISIYSAALGE